MNAYSGLVTATPVLQTLLHTNLPPGCLINVFLHYGFVGDRWVIEVPHQEPLIYASQEALLETLAAAGIPS